MNSTEHARKAANALWTNKESRDRLIELRRNPEYKARVSTSMKKTWKNRNHNISEEHKNKIGRASKNAWNLRTKEKRELIGKKISILRKGFKFSDETKSKMSTAKKKMWLEEPERARKCLICNSPNKQEIKLMNILDSMYPGEWKFVGNGQVIIAGKCPDYINVNGQKKIIELWGERWHQNENPQDRINVFKPFGYETLVIWGKEFESIGKLKHRIESFCRGV